MVRCGKRGKSMLLTYFLMTPNLWPVPWLLQSLGYFFVLKKMGLRRWTCIVPFQAEREMTGVLFERMRVFYRPFIVAAALMGTAYYIGPSSSWAIVLRLVSFVVYGVFLFRLYWRLGRSFGKNVFFRFGMMLFPCLFLLILGLGRSRYTRPRLRPVKQHSLPVTILLNVLHFLISAVELGLLILFCFFVIYAKRAFPFMIRMDLADKREKFSVIKSNDHFYSREDLIEGGSPSEDLTPSREHFFPDHSNDQNAVVLAYVIGADLEGNRGLCSANIQQMIDATSQGDKLTFVMEAGGADRWFTDGIAYNSYGRYEIKNGQLKKVEALPDDTCMSEEKTLEDFIRWGRENYEADRYMLVLWDHGGGFMYGYGVDEVNTKKPENEEEESLPLLSSTDIITALKNCDVKFDLIGFDACLMQDIELAVAMEPYADYYLASEETEGGYGWYYTEPFGALAQNPGMSTEEFAQNILSCYDQLNTILKGEEGEVDTMATLSLVDTTLVVPAYDRFCGLLTDIREAVEKDPAAYASVAAAGNNAYAFDGNFQVDLVDLLTVMKKADYKDLIRSDEEMDKIIRDIQTCILYRNKDSAAGINGIAVSFPYRTIAYYPDINKELRNFSLEEEEHTFNTIFSIMAAQKKAEADKKASQASENVGILERLEALFPETDYTEQDWYIEGFEDYSDAEVLLNIPLIKSGEGYKIDLPQKAWDTILDCRTAVYRKVSEEADADVVYLGCDYIGMDDEEGHPMIGIDGTWIYIDGQMVCFEAVTPRETEDGVIFSGKIPARLNDKEDILVNIEWAPATEDGPETEGFVTGYEKVGMEYLPSILQFKGEEDFEAGDRIRFVFDTFDVEGNQVSSEPQGKTITVTKQSRLKVTEEPIPDGTVIYNGVLTDMFQRILTTEDVEVKIGE